MHELLTAINDSLPFAQTCQTFIETSVTAINDLQKESCLSEDKKYSHGPIIYVSFRSSHQRCSVKNVFLQISQNSEENTCARASLLIRLQARDLQLYLKGGSGTGVFL